MGRIAVLAACVLAGTAVAVLPGALAMAFVAGVAALLVLCVLPMRALLVVWGASLPIWAIGPVDPLAFDALRVMGSVVIAVRSRGQVASGWTFAVRSWAAPLALVGGLMAVTGLIRGDAAARTGGATILVALAVAWLVVGRTEDVRSILGGFMVGVTASGAVLLLTAAGFDALSPQDNPGFARFTGLAPSAPRVAIELATASALSFGYLLGRSHRRAATLSLAVCLAALLVSGGRVGLASLAVAAVVAVIGKWTRPGVVFGGAALVALVLWSAPRLGLQLNTLARTFDRSAPGGESFSSGRLEVLPDAIEAVLRAPLMGYGTDTFMAEQGIVPHTPVLAFAVAGGAIAGLVTLLLTLRILVRLLHPARTTHPVRIGAFLVLAVQFVSILVEPDGPFVGVASVTVLLITGALTERADPPAQANPATLAGLRVGLA